MTIVQLPDGRQAEFPDNMSKEEIKIILQQKFPKEITSTNLTNGKNNGFYPSEKPSEFKFGTPENKEFVEEMMTSVFEPGFKNVAAPATKGILSRIFGTAKKAYQKSQPLENELAEASKTLAESEMAAEIPKAGIISESPINELGNLENKIGKFINVEGAHNVRSAKGLTNKVKSIENFWSDSYKNFLNKVKDVNFQMPESSLEKLDKLSPKELIKTFGADAFEAIKKGKLSEFVNKQAAKESQNPYFDSIMKYAPTSKDKDAASFIAKYKDFRDALGGLKTDLKSKNITSIEKKKISEAIKQGKEVESNIKTALDEGLGEFKTEFDFVNEGYSTQVYPLRENPIVKAASKGKLSDNIIKSIRTNESGMGLVRDIIKQDPELLRNVVGQRYKIKPSEIHNPNELVREYLDELPEFKNLLSKKEKLLEETAKRKDISLKKKIDIENQLKEFKKERKKARTKLSVGTGIGAGVVGIPGYSQLKKLLGGNNE